MSGFSTKVVFNIKGGCLLGVRIFISGNDMIQRTDYWVIVIPRKVAFKVALVDRMVLLGGLALFIFFFFHLNIFVINELGILLYMFSYKLVCMTGSTVC